MALIITARNLSSTRADVADYEVGAWINDRPIWKGHVAGHRCSDGWAALARRIVEAYEAEPRSEPATCKSVQRRKARLVPRRRTPS